MTRLKKIAEDKKDLNKLNEENTNDQQNKKLIERSDVSLEAADISLNEISESIDELHDAYLKLFHGLNSLYTEFPKLYENLKKVVKFPDERIAQDISDMKVDFEEIKEHYNDEEYLKSILNLYKGETEDEKIN